METTRIRFGFRSKTQSPLFMIWKEYYSKNGEMAFAEVLFML